MKTGGELSIMETVVVDDTQMGGVQRLQPVKVTGALLQFPGAIELKVLVHLIEVQGSTATAPPLLRNHASTTEELFATLQSTDNGEAGNVNTGPGEAVTVKVEVAVWMLPHRSWTVKVTVVAELQPAGVFPLKLEVQNKLSEEAQLSVAAAPAWLLSQSENADCVPLPQETVSGMGWVVMTGGVVSMIEKVDVCDCELLHKSVTVNVTTFVTLQFCEIGPTLSLFHWSADWGAQLSVAIAPPWLFNQLLNAFWAEFPVISHWAEEGEGDVTKTGWVASKRV
jgi:hypothetical protein